MATIRSIETMYNGYRFRSRLEARWAVFFDAIGVHYEYEPEGYVLEDGTCYLPDFWLPDLRYWIEIKPREWKCDGDHGIWAMESDDAKAFLLCGEPRVGFYWPEISPAFDFREQLFYSGRAPGDIDYIWCQCPACGSLGIQYEGRSERNRHLAGCKYLHFDGKCHGGDAPLLLAAYALVSEARFEHGQTWSARAVREQARRDADR